MRQRILSVMATSFAIVLSAISQPDTMANIGAEQATLIKEVHGVENGTEPHGFYLYPAPILPVPAEFFADVNGDGILDAIGGKSVALGKGNGTFLSSQEIGNSVSIRAAADLDGDGRLDLVATGTGIDLPPNDPLEVLRGNGDGTFSSVQILAVGLNPVSVAVGDFNHDSHLDLVVANAGSYDLSVLLGNGNATFQAPQTYDLSFVLETDLRIVLIADINEDGFSDLLAANVILLGNGNGTFQTPTSLFQRSAYARAIADFNSDGHMDVITNSSVWLGNGDGTFQRGSRVPSGVRIAVEDMDSDGHLDVIALCCRFGSNSTVSIALGKGDGTFQEPRSFPASRRIGIFSSMAIIDLDSDGRLDVVPSTGVVLFGNGNGTLQTYLEFDAGYEPEGIVTSDFNQDSLVDVIVTNPHSVSILLGNGDGTFQAAQTFRTGSGTRLAPESIMTSDLNQDGLLDLVAVSDTSHAVSVFLGNGDGSFQTPQRFFSGGTSAFPRKVVIADLNEDTKLDLVTLNKSSRDVSLLLGNGDGTFQAAQNFAVGEDNFCGLVVADVNTDGHLDLTVSVRFGNVSVLFGNGDGSFRPPQVFRKTADGCLVAIVDLNSDAHLDLITDRAVALGNGDGTFRWVEESVRADVIADLNADGRLDLISGSSIQLGNGDGTFQPPQEFATCGGAGSIAIADVDRDSQPDLIATSAAEHCNNISVLIHR